MKETLISITIAYIIFSFFKFGFDAVIGFILITILNFSFFGLVSAIKEFKGSN